VSEAYNPIMRTFCRFRAGVLSGIAAMSGPDDVGRWFERAYGGRRFDRPSYTPWKWEPFAHRSGDVNVIDPTKVHFPRLPPHRKILLLMLLLAVKDFATEIRLEPWRDEGAEGSEGRAPELRIFYEVDGQFHELVPAPGFVAPLIARDMAIIAGFETPDDRVPGFLRRLADWIHRPDSPLIPGWIRWRHGDFEGDIEVVIYPSDWGDRLFLRLPEIPVVASDRAQALLRQIMEARREAKGNS
jgi:hypothetical protein